MSKAKQHLRKSRQYLFPQQRGPQQWQLKQWGPQQRQPQFFVLVLKYTPWVVLSIHFFICQTALKDPYCLPRLCPNLGSNLQNLFKELSFDSIRKFKKVNKIKNKNYISINEFSGLFENYLEPVLFPFCKKLWMFSLLFDETKTINCEVFNDSLFLLWKQN